MLKGKGVENIPILDKLLEMREKLNTLINRVKQDLGLGFGKGSLAHVLGFQGSGLGNVDSRVSWAEKGNKKPNGSRENVGFGL